MRNSYPASKTEMTTVLATFLALIGLLGCSRDQPPVPTVLSAPADTLYVQIAKDSVVSLRVENAAGVVEIELKTEMEPVSLSVSQAVVCGQVASELLSNAIKHAFPNGASGSIRISIRPDGTQGIELRVTDDGIGLPEETVFEEPRSLGMWLVKTFVEQLGGQVDVDTAAEVGTDVRVVFQRS